MIRYSFIFSLFFIYQSSFTFAQKAVIEDTLIVKGICDMCKERIEEAAYGSGVKFASWNKATDELSIAFREDKTSADEIEQRVAAAGHTTANYSAKEEDYNKLPDCCRYEHGHKH